MTKFYILGFLSAFVVSSNAQALFNNNGAEVHVKNGALLAVKTNSLTNNTVSGLGGFYNEGTVIVEGNFTNNGIITASTDTILLSGDWVNNGTYTTNTSLIDLFGGNQLMTGSSVTVFNNLNLAGPSASVKQQTINAEVTGILSLNNSELATAAFEMLVSNSSSASITRSNGFVSSVGNGRLSRATSTQSTYLFPVGSPSQSNPPSIFRPIHFVPSASSANVYGAMVVKGDATNDGFNVESFDENLCRVNPMFYHKLYHTSGTDASDVAISFDPNTDGIWSDIAHWKTSTWNQVPSPIATSLLGLQGISVSNISDFNPEPFALAAKKFTVNVGADAEIELGESVNLSATHTSPNASNYQWYPNGSLSCSNCLSTTARPESTTQYVISVNDNFGCIASDSVTVKVNIPHLFIPTAFTPNGDGRNNVFKVLNNNVEKLNLLVFNRWGEKIYEGGNPREGWDGTFKGEQQEMGVYAWICEYKLAGQTKVTIAKGNVTLVR